MLKNPGVRDGPQRLCFRAFALCTPLPSAISSDLAVLGEAVWEEPPLDLGRQMTMALRVDVSGGAEIALHNKLTLVHRSLLKRQLGFQPH